MALKAKKPEAIQKRLKLFMFAAAKVGKTTASIQFPKAYIIDTERGTEWYDSIINAAESVVLRTDAPDEIMAEVRELGRGGHDYQTLVIDPITTMYARLVDEMERKHGQEWGRHVTAAKTWMRRLASLLMDLDMNVVITCHQKTVWKESQAQVVDNGFTFDGWDKLDYLFDLILHLERSGAQDRTAVSLGGRLQQAFPFGEKFPWSYAEMKRRFEAVAGPGVIDRRCATVIVASEAQVGELEGLLKVVTMGEDWLPKILAAANVDTLADMPADKIQKCIDLVRGRVAPVAVAANEAREAATRSARIAQENAAQAANLAAAKASAPSLTTGDKIAQPKRGRPPKQPETATKTFDQVATELGQRQAAINGEGDPHEMSAAEMEAQAAADASANIGQEGEQPPAEATTNGHPPERLFDPKLTTNEAWAAALEEACDAKGISWEEVYERLMLMFKSTFGSKPDIAEMVKWEAPTNQRRRRRLWVAALRGKLSRTGAIDPAIDAADFAACGVVKA